MIINAGTTVCARVLWPRGDTPLAKSSVRSHFCNGASCIWNADIFATIVQAALVTGSGSDGRADCRQHCSFLRAWMFELLVRVALFRHVSPFNRALCRPALGGVATEQLFARLPCRRSPSSTLCARASSPTALPLTRYNPVLSCHHLARVR